jgi:pimeloyl-ACP methyl ester carboxylesterase
VILLHGGLGHSGNWGYQVPALMDAGYRAVLTDSRGHGRSTRDARPYAPLQRPSQFNQAMIAFLDRGMFGN